MRKRRSKSFRPSKVYRSSNGTRGHSGRDIRPLPAVAVCAVWPAVNDKLRHNSLARAPPAPSARRPLQLSATLIDGRGAENLLLLLPPSPPPSHEIPRPPFIYRVHIYTYIIPGPLLHDPPSDSIIIYCIYTRKNKKSWSFSPACATQYNGGNAKRRRRRRIQNNRFRGRK